MARSKAGKAIPHTGQYVRHVQVWLTDEQFEKLNRDYRTCGFRHREAYLRQLIEGAQPRAAPPLEYRKLMEALYRIGNNMNQIAVKAHTLHAIDAKHYDEAYRQLLETVQEITAAFVLPAAYSPVTEAADKQCPEEEMNCGGNISMADQGLVR